eukprot:12991899-Alexandrium_andersonii.AAC.1
MDFATSRERQGFACPLLCSKIRTVLPRGMLLLCTPMGPVAAVLSHLARRRRVRATRRSRASLVHAS